jgi:hypothetical protein
MTAWVRAPLDSLHDAFHLYSSRTCLLVAGYALQTFGTFDIPFADIAVGGGLR